VGDEQQPVGASGVEEMRVTIPLEVTIRLGAPQTTTQAVGTAAAATSVPANQADLDAAVAEAQRLYGQRPDVYKVEHGWQFTNGWITDQRAVVFAVRSKMAPETLRAQGIVSLPQEILGVPVDIRVATLEEVSPVVELEARGWQSTYERLEDEETLLAAVDETMTVTVCASPDAGWPVLSEFLSGTTERLTVGMYDFTAPHIVDAITEATAPGDRLLTLVLQHGEDVGEGTKKDDIPEEQSIEALTGTLADRFQQEWAAKGGAASPFKSAYHIKVAVRDGTALWLSSGNWQSSNQPNADPVKGPDETPSLISAYNRDWHVVLTNPTLAATYERYLQHDLEQARAAAEEAVALPELMVWVPAGYFQPSAAELEGRVTYTPPKQFADTQLRVQPILTPDNYAPHVVDLIESAHDYIYFQNQSLSVLDENPDHYENLLQALLHKQQAGLDVKIIIRKIGDLRKTVSRIRDYGFDTDQQLRVQTNCHTKGVIVDGKAVLIGSQNWTGDGTGLNRDASVIFYNTEIANYYQQLFLYDWNRVGAPKIDESLPAPELADPTELTPRPGMVLMPLDSWRGEL
jgi:hypothetical protein